jgi:hypothetical protein
MKLNQKLSRNELILIALWAILFFTLNFAFSGSNFLVGLWVTCVALFIGLSGLALGEYIFK